MINARHQTTPVIAPKFGQMLCALGLIGFGGLAQGYELFLVGSVMIYAIATAGLNLLVGQSGLISLGHGVFFAIGAYTTAIIMTYAEPLAWVTPLAGALTAAIFAYLVGKPILRMEPMHLALGTFALAITMPTIVRSDLISAYTGGSQGLFLLLPPAPKWLGLSDERFLFFVTLIYFLTSLWAVGRLANGLNGQAWRATRDNEIASRALGIDLSQAKMRAFSLSSAFCGTAGGLFALQTQYVAPDSYTFLLSISLFTAVLVGGMGSVVLGPVLGALFIVLVPNFSEDIWQGGTWAIYGMIIIILMAIDPGGLAGLIDRLGNRLRSRS